MWLSSYSVFYFPLLLPVCFFFFFFFILFVSRALKLICYKPFLKQTFWKPEENEQAAVRGKSCWKQEVGTILLCCSLTSALPPLPLAYGVGGGGPHWFLGLQLPTAMSYPGSPLKYCHSLKITSCLFFN